MIQSKKRWQIERPDEQLVSQLAKDVKLSTMIAKILVARGVTTSEQATAYLEMDESNLHDPFLLYGMKETVELIKQAITEQKQITVYGDYDCDGVTSVTVLTTALERLDANVNFAIPNRFEHGYGPNKDYFAQLHAEGTEILITVDNGISGIEEVAFAKSLGMTVIVTDHHEIGEELPAADAVIHPRHPEGEYPFGELAGVGVAFKLASALLGEPPLDLLEFVAIGTVADLVPLKDENRYAVKEGIRRLRRSVRPAIKALMQVSGHEQNGLTEETIGFTIGPRLNAPGRLGDADPAVYLLKSDDEQQAMGIAEELNEINKERQQLVKEIAKEAEQQVALRYGDKIPHVFVIEGEDWNLGVVGIVASRLTEKYYRPSIILSVDYETGVAKGSARSIEGFDLFKELSKNKEILPHFGGHEMAAGMSLKIEDVELLRENLNEQAKQVLTDELLQPKLSIDVPLALDEIDIASIEALELIRPFGVGFSKPVFLLENLETISTRKIGAAKDHLKLEMGDGDERLDAIYFGAGALADEMAPQCKLSLTGDLQINEWNGRKKAQLLVGDVKCEDWQLFDYRGVRDPARWLPLIPEHAIFIAFTEQATQHFAPFLQGFPILLVGRDELVSSGSIVLLDMPQDNEQLQKTIEATQPDRIYLHLYVHDSMYFEKMPDRQQFGWYYSFLKQRGSFDMKNQLDTLSKHKGWKKDMIKFMTKVFYELEFVTLENGEITMLASADKRDLAEAPSYKKRQQQIKLEELLLYAPYQDLKKVFDSLQKIDAVEEEKLWI
ncbi:single-stranded-DNA-specific exonuclease RecJ [Sporosarcina sp. GW1-11]|uniref:single-stranded-DNA-specific exonuclease RecJ n=1 Tax=Sporosarcina sp. GW1-11 TaxID=2899126 RepID=UPI00294E888C|nr:single-stranded-DNA-specific exonuclease RecJ [Sporosarcina sp. GW1-11]MDV6377191.1 single-stranded-DNA-specific exonuclease RecJ [Sporosarcina sp. GW1-11]